MTDTQCPNCLALLSDLQRVSAEKEQLTIALANRDYVLKEQVEFGTSQMREKNLIWEKLSAAESRLSAVETELAASRNNLTADAIVEELYAHYAKGFDEETGSPEVCLERGFKADLALRRLIAGRLSAVEAERDEARQIVADVNNEVIGSHGYFTKPSCVEAVQKLKFYFNRDHSRLATLLQGVEGLEQEWKERSERPMNGRPSRDIDEAEAGYSAACFTLRECVKRLTTLRSAAQEGK